MSKIKLSITWMWMGVLLCGVPMRSSFADEVYTFVVKKQEEKKKTRWTLAEWLETRDRMRLMDLWLAMNSESPYEFYLDGQYQFAKEPKTQNDLNGWGGSFVAYAKIFGLEATYRAGEKKHLLGLFHLRLLGAHSQATNLTLSGGISSELGAASNRNWVAGANMSLYLARFFGLNAGYLHYFAQTQKGGEHYEGNAFVDFSFLRIYGGYFGETVPQNRRGFLLGSRIYF